VHGACLLLLTVLGFVMFKSLGMLWVGMSVFFMAFEQFAKGLLSLCTAGAEMAGEFEDEARRERLAKRKEMELLDLQATVVVPTIATSSKAKA
jgi:hypothetical protein